MPRLVRFHGRSPASPAASVAARASSKKRDTKPEMLLRAALWKAGVRGYRVDAKELPGRPDLVFRRVKVAVFCDGDFWHGRDLEARVAKLGGGHNAAYWVAKIEGNVARDRKRDAELHEAGWLVMRFWESAIKRDADAIAGVVKEVVARRKAGELT